MRRRAVSGSSRESNSKKAKKLGRSRNSGTDQLFMRFYAVPKIPNNRY